MKHVRFIEKYRVEIDGGDFLDDFEEAVGFVELFDLLVELEFLDDFAGAGGEAGDVFGEVSDEFVGVAEEGLEGEAAGVVEIEFELPVDHLLDGVGIILAAGLQFLVFGDDLVLGCLQYTVEAAQNRERNHHTAVLRRPVRAAQKIGDVPDDVAVLFESVEVFHKQEGTF